MKNENEKISHSKYKYLFGVNNYDKDNDKLKMAFIQASDIRKFEIDLYWKRANYFWTLISVAFAGYFAVIGTMKEPYQYLCSLIIASIGIVFTIAWLLANRGSKHWLENWENHLDLLEDGITGPLYKTVLERSEYDDCFERYITGPYPHSVSKINQWIAVFVICIWCSMFSLSLVLAWQQLSDFHVPNIAYIILFLMPVLIALLLFFILKKGGTHKGNHHPYAVLRETKISSKNKYY
ncbi:RipA family octameric membrane protein [Yersinia enterocolitica]|uniref:RipA family octameric membrane protein n=1 Tax=Yersinia enterocolitica TaxID=630 RepID=UPI003E331B10